MKKVLTLTSVLALAACGQNAKYQETGLVCEDATHNSGAAEITLDVRANDDVANVVINGESLKLTVQPSEDAMNIDYYGKNANDEKVKLHIAVQEDGTIKYMLGVNSDEVTYGCAKKVESETEEVAK